MNFINVGVEQMLKAIQDFVFLFLILWFLPFPPPPMRKTWLQLAEPCAAVNGAIAWPLAPPGEG